MDIYKSLNINIGTVMKNPEMLISVLDHLKTKKMCNFFCLSYIKGLIVWTSINL